MGTKWICKNIFPPSTIRDESSHVDPLIVGSLIEGLLCSPLATMIPPHLGRYVPAEIDVSHSIKSNTLKLSNSH